MRRDHDPLAASAGADLEARAILGKRIGPQPPRRCGFAARRSLLLVVVDERDRYQEIGTALVVRVIDVTDRLEVKLVPVVGPFLGGIPPVAVFDAVAERVFGASKLPGEYLGSLGGGGGVCYDGRILPRLPGRSVETDQPVFAADFPIIIIVLVRSAVDPLDPRKESFGARPVTGCAGRRAGHGHQVFGAGEDEGVPVFRFGRVVPVTRNA